MDFDSVHHSKSLNLLDEIQDVDGRGNENL